MIDKYTVLLDFDKLGFAIRANLVIRAAPDNCDKQDPFYAYMIM